MALTATQSKSMYQFFALAFNAAPGVTYMNQLDAALNSGMSVTQVVEAFTAKAEFTSTYPNFLSNAAFATKFINSNVGSYASDAAKAAAIADVTAALNAGWSRGKTITQVFTNINALSETDATWGTFVKGINNDVAYAQYYTETLLGGAEATPNLAALRAVIANVTPTTSILVADMAAVLNPAPVPVAQTFTLTTDSNNFAGGAANDVFTAGYTAANGMTLQSTDTLSGGAGTDTLNVSVGAAGVVQASVSGIETISANFSAGGTISLLGTTGATTVESAGSTNAAIFSNIPSASTALKASNTAFGTTFGFTNASLTGSTDTVAVTLNNVTAGTVTVQPASGTNGAETIAITSSGSPNSITLDDGTSTSLTTLTIAGDQSLALVVTPTTVTTINASANTGGLTHTTTGTLATSVTGGSGNDAITLGAAAVADSVNAGAGDDTITFSGNLTNTDTINGGDGNDTLVFDTSADGTGYTAPTTATISGFETLTFTNAIAAGLTTATIQAGINTLNLTGGTNAQTVVMEAGAKTVRIGAANTGTLTVTDTGTATTDSLTVAKTTGAFSIFGAAAGGLVVNGYETVTINGTSTTATPQTATVITLTPDTGGTSTLNLTGNSSLTTTGAITANVINASGLTGTAVLTMGAAAADGLTSITGSANADTLIGDASSSIDGGAGNDAITGGSGNDTLLGGAGDDSITAGTGNDSIDAGAGNDTITIAGNLTAADTISGGAGNDTLSIGAAATLATAANISGIEILTVTTAGLTTDLSVYATNNALTRLNESGAAGAYTVTGAGAAFTTLAAGTAADTFTFSRAVNTLSDSLTFIGLTAATTTALTASGEETLTLQSSSTGQAVITDIDAAALTTLLISGTGGVTVTNAIANATALATITDTHTGTGTLTVNATNSTAAITFTSGAATGNTTLTTGSGNDIITAGSSILIATAGSGNDSVTGGALADTIDGGTGNDTINGGAGADSLTGGAGADSITGGEGADRIIPGSNNDSINLTETTAAIDTIVYAETGPVNVDTVTGFTVASDLVEVSIGAFTGSVLATLSAANGTDIGAAIAAGAFTTESVAAGATTANTAGTNFIFLSDKTYSSFANAVNGTGTGSYAVTDANFTQATEGVLTVWYDVSNSQAVIGVWVDDSRTATDLLTSADTFVEVVRIGMTSANYTLANLDALMSAA